jgi:uncharacterized protein (DUF2062 family)
MSDGAAQPSDSQAKPSLGKRFRDHILHPELSTEQVAWSFAIGFAIAWNPLLGTHTGMILVLCFAFRRLHRPLMLLACFINNPWTLVPMATASAYLGNLMLGRGLALDLTHIQWKAIGWRSFTSWEGLMAVRRMVEPILAPYLLGGFAFTLLALVLGYFGMRWLTRRLRQIHWKDIHLPHPHFHLHHNEESRTVDADPPQDGNKR